MSAIAPPIYSIASGMDEIDQASWDALASRYGSPFLTWGFLALLESSGSVCGDAGWLPCHVLATRSGKLVAAAPFYLRSHSMGDFVFDFSVAEAAESIGAKYYPKLVGVIPLTPVPAWRVMTAAGEDALAAPLLEYARGFARQVGAGGMHLLWVDPEFESAARGEGRVEWRHQRYSWRNEGYVNFTDYLSTFSKNMRRNVLREKRSVADKGIVMRVVGPSEATPAWLEAMADFYVRTNQKFVPYNAQFLDLSFFRRLPEFMPGGWLLSAAFEAASEEPLALALLFEGASGVFGRYWGCSRDVDALHFEVCYYRPIEYAIDSGKSVFDPGMGGEHKARRGFRSTLTSSFHDVFDARLSNALRTALVEANREEGELAASLDKELPFK